MEIKQAPPGMPAAKMRTHAIRKAMAMLAKAHTVVALARKDEDWRLLGYPSWEAYLATEFSQEEAMMPERDRLWAIKELALGDGDYSQSPEDQDGTGSPNRVSNPELLRLSFKALERGVRGPWIEANHSPFKKNTAERSLKVAETLLSVRGNSTWCKTACDRELFSIIAAWVKENPQ